MTDDLTFAPFGIQTLDDGSHELWLFDGDMEQVQDVFEELNAESNGHGWESLAWWLTHSERPDLADTICFSSEGGTFVVGSDDPAALRWLAGRLHAAFHDRSKLAQLITDAEAD